MARPDPIRIVHDAPAPAPSERLRMLKRVTDLAEQARNEGWVVNYAVELAPGRECVNFALTLPGQELAPPKGDAS